MKKSSALVLLTFVTMFSGCAIVGDIFKAGMWWGIILVVGFILLIGYIVRKVGGGKK